MRIKKFEAFEMSQVLRAIRQELGPDAVILSTREVRKEEFGMLSRPMIEVTVAVDPAAPTPAGPGKGSQAFHPFLEELCGSVQTPESEISAVREELRAIRAAVESLRPDNGSDQKSSQRLLQATWGEMKGLLKTLVEQQCRNELSDTHENLLALFRRLTANGVVFQAAAGLLKTVKERLSEEDLWREDFVRYYLGEMIRGMVQVSGPLPERPEGTKVVALVGPTGVGKTTTILKLAAQQALRGEKSVTVASLDTYRVGATEQLKSYAKMIGVPVMLAASGSELGEMISRRSPKGLVLIDTPGRSPLNVRQVKELQDLEKVGVPVETHLVLSFNTKEADISEAIDRFSVISIDRLLFTKMDETRTFGALLSAVRRKDKPISYLTMGQRVPDDIEAATPRRVAELILG